MAKRSTPSDKTVIDSVFTIPEGAEEQFVYADETVYNDNGGFDDSLSELDFEVVDEIDYEVGYDEDQYGEDSLEVPDDFVILSQTLRRGPGGQQVVDIVIETEDIEGAVKYEIQVTKA